MKTFCYALVNRPPSIGAVPKVLFTIEPRPAAGQPHYALARHGIMVTEQELTHEQCKAFELAQLIDHENLDWLAAEIADTMKSYASSYVDMEESNPDLFHEIVTERINRIGSGVYYSVAEPDALVDRVLVFLEVLAGSVKNKQ